jgi:integrase
VYRASPEFAGLAPATRHKYSLILDELKPLDGMPLALVTTEFLYSWRDKKAKERGSRSFANAGITVLRLVFNWGKRRGKCKVNPASDVETIRRPRNTPTKNRPWRPHELEAVLSACPAWFRVPLTLSAYTGLRESDVVRVGWECYDGQTIETKAQKTGAPIWVPAHPRLREVLDALPRGKTIVLGAKGRPITTSFIRTTLYATLGALVATGKVGHGLSFHGLRHTLGTALAEAGCDPPTIAGVLGQATTQMAEHYSRTANRRGLVSAAMKKMENETENRPARS